MPLKVLRSVFFTCASGVTCLFSQLTAQNFEAVKYEAPRFRYIQAVHIYSPARILLAGGWPSMDSLTGLFISTDSGKSWGILRDGFGGILRCISSPDNINTYVCGRFGKFAVSDDLGANWTFKDLGTYSDAEFMAVSFVNKQNGLLAGGGNTGNRSLILRTTDGGNNWLPVLDSANGKLFSLAQSGAVAIATGENGLIYRSTDSGQNWARIYPPQNIKSRQLKSITFADNSKAIIVGGYPKRDSIQTILRSEDAGLTWSVIRDTKGHKLNSVICNGKTAMAAGDSGMIFYSSDKGESWKRIYLHDSLKDNRNLQCIDLMNGSYSFVGGEFGRIVKLIDKSAIFPSVSLDEIIITTQNKIRLNALVEPKGYEVQLYFEYGVKPQPESSIDLGSFKGNSPVSPHNAFSIADGYYWGRLHLKSDNYSAFTPFIAFSKTPTDNRNFNFEFWDTTVTRTLNDWQVKGKFKEYVFDNGSRGIKISPENSRDNPGVVYIAGVDQDSLTGGIPFRYKPDSVYVSCRLDVAANDTATLYLWFKDSTGKYIHQPGFTITGTTSADTVLSFPVNLSHSMSPDSLIIIFLSTNFFSGKIDTMSSLYLDSIWFSGVSPPVPNAGFSKWSDSVQVSLRGWTKSHISQNHLYNGAEISKQPQSGAYALRLKSNNDSYINRILCGNYPIEKKQSEPGFSINQRYQNLHGYYQFMPENAGDSLRIVVSTYRDGTMNGSGLFYAESATTGYNKFKLGIQYFDTLTPDSALLLIEIFNGKGQQTKASALLDNFAFDAWIDPVYNVSTINQMVCEMHVYPMPTSGIIHIQSACDEAIREVRLYSSDGKMVLKKENTSEFIIPDRINQGIYYLHVESKIRSYTQKIILIKP